MRIDYQLCTYIWQRIRYPELLQRIECLMKDFEKYRTKQKGKSLPKYTYYKGNKRRWSKGEKAEGNMFKEIVNIKTRYRNSNQINSVFLSSSCPILVRFKVGNVTGNPAPDKVVKEAI
jgi:hypothetical protein